MGVLGDLGGTRGQAPGCASAGSLARPVMTWLTFIWSPLPLPLCLLMHVCREDMPCRPELALSLATVQTCDMTRDKRGMPNRSRGLPVNVGGGMFD